MILLVPIISRPVFAEQASETVPLSRQLADLAEETAKKVPPEKNKAMEEEIAKIREFIIPGIVYKPGRLFPDAMLLEAKSGEYVSLYQFIGEKPAVITFFRGSWCPYCNLQLTSFQENLEKIKKLGVVFVAISPEIPKGTRSSKYEGKWPFPIFSDPLNKFAIQLGIAYHVTKDLQDFYRSFGIDLMLYHRNIKWDLPVTSTFVLDPSHKITATFFDADYKMRPEPETIIKELEKMVSSQ